MTGRILVGGTHVDDVNVVRAPRVPRARYRVGVDEAHAVLGGHACGRRLGERAAA